MKNSSRREKSSTSTTTPSSNEKLSKSKRRRNKTGALKHLSLPSLPLKSRIKHLNLTSVMPGCPHGDTHKISTDKLSSSFLDSQATSLLQTLDQASTSRENHFKPFWTTQSKEISEKLPSHIKTRSAVSVLSCSGQSSPDAPMGKSWFPIAETSLQQKNSHPISSPSLLSLLPDCADCGATKSKRNSTSSSKKKEKQVRTLKGRILPTKEEKLKLQMMMEQSRWYYNFLVGVINSHYSKEKMVEKGSFCEYQIRDFLTSYSYKEEQVENMIHRCFEERPDKETNTKQVIPDWWEGKVHTRLPRGVAKKITQNLNSMISNYTNGNIKDFELRCRSSKKTLNDFLLFEDKGFPVFIRRMKGRYCFTGKDGRKKRCSLQDLFEQTDPKGVEIIYEKDTGKYFFHYPVDADFYPEGDRRNENQVPLRSLDGKRIISLDPGVRKFMVGYDPDGKVIFVGKDAHREILQLLLEVDKVKSKKIWRNIKNKISELHWKTIHYLMLHYDHIMIPDFKVSQMLKGKKISRQTKRMLCMYSFHSFMLKLKYKCKKNEKKLYVVDEAWTSKTCTLCGKINDVGGKEVYQCGGCGNEVDRDVNGSRNILIKNLRQ